MKNDCYHKFNIVSNNDSVNTLTSQIIYPCDPKIIKKYSQSQFKLVKETPEVYNKITKVYAENIPKEKWNWIYNVLDNGAEAEKTFYMDKDPESGFTLCLDIGTGSEIKENFHCLALVEARDLLSMRDLNESHLPLLHKMDTEGRKQVSKYFEVPEDQIRCYFHYHPSFYHLHLHYSHVMHLAHGVTTERAHMLTDVISNISLVGSYYQKATIEFPLRSTDAFYEHIISECEKSGITMYK